MSNAETPSALLSLVPDVLREKVSNHWLSWTQACQQINQSPDGGLDLAELGKLWACSDFLASVMIRQPKACRQSFDDELRTTKGLQQYLLQLTEILSSLPAAMSQRAHHGLPDGRVRRIRSGYAGLFTACRSGIQPGGVCAVAGNARIRGSRSPAVP